MDLKCLTIIQLLVTLMLIWFAGWLTSAPGKLIYGLQVALFVYYVVGIVMCDGGRIELN
jgi:hypothetical protein